MKDYKKILYTILYAPGAYPRPTSYEGQDVQDLQLRQGAVNAARGTDNPSESRAAWQVAQAVETERDRMGASWRPSPGMPAEWNRQDKEDFDTYRAGKTTAESNAAREADRVAERVRTTGTKRPDEFITTVSSNGRATSVPITKRRGSWGYDRRMAAANKQAERTAFVMSDEGAKERREIEIEKATSQKAYNDAVGKERDASGNIPYAVHKAAADARRLTDLIDRNNRIA